MISFSHEKVRVNQQNGRISPEKLMLKLCLVWKQFCIKHIQNLFSRTKTFIVFTYYSFFHENNCWEFEYIFLMYSQNICSLSKIYENKLQKPSTNCKTNSENLTKHIFRTASVRPQPNSGIIYIGLLLKLNLK